MGVDNFLVPSALAAAIAQRLVRRLCNDCKIKERPSPQIAKIIDTELKALPPLARKKLKTLSASYIWKGQGCKLCAHKGYRGRIAIFEVAYGRLAPPKVVINEAVELAKTFGSESSSRFVNGVLGSLVQESEEA